MPLTQRQRRSLRVYEQFRNRPMSIGTLLWASRKTYLYLLMLFGFLATLFYYQVSEETAAILILMLVVILLRDIGYMRRSAAIWPVLREVIDWDLVAEKLRPESSRPTPDGDLEKTP